MLHRGSVAKKRRRATLRWRGVSNALIRRGGIIRRNERQLIFEIILLFIQVCSPEVQAAEHEERDDDDGPDDWPDRRLFRLLLGPHVAGVYLYRGLIRGCVLHGRHDVSIAASFQLPAFGGGDNSRALWDYFANFSR